MSAGISERFSHYRLSGLIPENNAIVLDHELRIITQFQVARETCAIVEQQQFSSQEWELLSALIENYPYHCPFATLLSIYEHKSPEHCQRRLNRAVEDGDFNELVRPVRNGISRVRLKLHDFGIDIKSIIETGYLLLPDEKHATAKKGKW